MGKRFVEDDGDFAVRRKLRRKHKRRGIVRWPDTGEQDLCPLTTAEIIARLYRAMTGTGTARGAITADPVLSELFTLLPVVDATRIDFARIGPDGQVRKACVSQREMIERTSVGAMNRLIASRLVSLFDGPHPDDPVVTRGDLEDGVGVEFSDNVWQKPAPSENETQRWERITTKARTGPTKGRVQQYVNAILSSVRESTKTYNIAQLADYLMDVSATWATVNRNSWCDGRLVLDMTRYFPTHGKNYLTAFTIVDFFNKHMDAHKLVRIIMEQYKKELTRKMKEVPMEHCISEIMQNSRHNATLIGSDAWERDEVLMRMSATRR